MWDVEGNFSALRKLLQANKIITEDFNWQFGKGHLVLIGDFFDRGEQVTELLWFIYSLEEKAKDAGGYVHFILGNHEIMNLSADLRYVNKIFRKCGFIRSKIYIALWRKLWIRTMASYKKYNWKNWWFCFHTWGNIKCYQQPQFIPSWN